MDIEALRQFRIMNPNSNWLKDVRTELFLRMYDRSIHPANIWLAGEPGRNAEGDEICLANIARLVEAGTYTQPAHRFPGARHLPGPGDGDMNAIARWCGEARCGMAFCIRSVEAGTSRNPGECGLGVNLHGCWLSFR